MKQSARENLLFAWVALVGALVITRGLIARPGYTDAFYYVNAADRLVSGQGLTDPYLWTYIGAPDQIPGPSHLYWMPLASLIAALGMWIFNAPGDYAAAQTLFTLSFAGTVYIGYFLGKRLGGTRRHAWVAGIITLLSGFFVRFWGASDTFAPFALIGSLCLICLGLGAAAAHRKPLWFALAGVLAALGHLTRADGVLLLAVGWVVIVWPRPSADSRESDYHRRPALLGILTLAYLLVMLPWFLRNLHQVGAPLPTGGTQGIWFTEYNQLFDYPPDASPAKAFAGGVGAFLDARWQALTGNLGTFVAVEGLVAMAPLMLVGLWRRRTDGFLRGFWLYALGLHLIMTLVFPLPGYRGGLFHSAAALVPWWAALGVVGLDDVIDWIAEHRRRWKPTSAKRVFSVGLVLLALTMSLSTAAPGRVTASVPSLYRNLVAVLPADARVMINDPAALYYFTGLSGVVLPNESPDIIPEIAQRYQVTHLLLEGVTADGQAARAAPSALWPVLTDPPDFLESIPFENPTVRLYAIIP